MTSLVDQNANDPLNEMAHIRPLTVDQASKNFRTARDQVSEADKKILALEIQLEEANELAREARQFYKECKYCVLISVLNEE